MVNKLTLTLFFIISIFALQNVNAQIKISELSQENLSEIDSTFFGITAKRPIIRLNKNWQVYSEKNKSSKVDVNIPASFEGEDELVFEKSITFTPDEIRGRKLIVTFLGVNYSSEILFNNFVISKQIAALIPFSVELPKDLINIGVANTLAVKIKHDLDSENTVPLKQRFLFPRNNGGIVRDVYLQFIPEINISSIELKKEFEESYSSVKINAAVTLENLYTQNDSGYVSSKDHELILKLLKDNRVVDETKSVVKFADREKIDTLINFEVNNPSLWSPGNPNNYILSAELLEDNIVIDKSIKKIALYDLKKDNNGFNLNGKNFSLEGVTYFTTSEQKGDLINYKQLEFDLNIIKDAGFNTIRFAKMIPHPYALKLCGKLGLFAFVELPLNSIPSDLASDESFKTRSRGVFRKEITYYSDYPSVIGFGVGSSFLADSPADDSFIKLLASEVKNNSDKFTYCSFVGFPKNKIDNLDLYGIEIYSKPIENLQEKFTKSINALGKNNIFISEATYPAYNGSSNGYLNKNSLEAEAKYFSDIIDYSRQNNLPGFVLNTMFDYPGDYKSFYTGYDENNIYKIGIVGIDRNLNRIPYQVIHSKLTHGKKVTIPIGSEKSETQLFFILTALSLSIIMALLVNTKRKFREDSSRALLRPYNFFADIRDHRILSGIHTIILMIILSGSLALFKVNILYFLRSNILMEKILLAFGIPEILAFNSFSAWHPVSAFFYSFGVSIIFFILLSFVIKIASFFIKNRVQFSSIYYTVIWSFLPLALLLPVELVLYRILIADIINLYIYIFLGLYLVWLIQRLLKGIYVIFDVNPSAVYFFSLLFLIFVFGGVLLYFQLTSNTIYYVINAFKLYHLI